MAKGLAVFTVIFAFIVAYITGATAQDRVPVIYPAVNSMHVAEGSSKNLSCYINTGGADVSANDLTWTVPSGKYTTNSMNDISKQILYKNLTIDSFTENNVGGYSCTYQNTVIEIYLYIIREDKIEGDYYHGNKTATLQCTLSFPESDKDARFVEWGKGNGSLPDDKRFQDYNNGTLVINEAKRTDCDLYIARYKIQNDEIYDCQVKFKGSPLVLDMSKSVNVVEGHSVDLKCLIKGYRIVNVTWLKDDKPIDRLVEMTRYPGNDERACRIRMSTYPESYENACLTIKSMNSSDAGRYTCLAIDEDGRSDNKSIIVRVKDELEWLWPVIGIVAEAIVLALVIFACSKIKKDDQSEQPGDERQGLLTEGTGVYRETKPE